MEQKLAFHIKITAGIPIYKPPTVDTLQWLTQYTGLSMLTGSPAAFLDASGLPLSVHSLVY